MSYTPAAEVLTPIAGSTFPGSPALSEARSRAPERGLREEGRRNRRRRLAELGPGLITGAADDDPSGIGTYSQAGAQFGLSLGWSVVACFPLMAAIQEISARLGRVTGCGVAGNLRRYCPVGLMVTMLALLVVANVINLAADIGAMAAAVELVIGGPEGAYALAFGVVTVGLQMVFCYRRQVRALKWLTLSLLAYPACLLATGANWWGLIADLVTPAFVFDRDHATMLVAVLGTTISPYLIFWQPAQEVERLRGEEGARPLRVQRHRAPAEHRRIRIDTVAGMAIANFIALTIMATTATTLHAAGVVEIQTAEQAALALRPIAGSFAFVVFAVGIIGTGLLAVPVLAGATAYAVGEACRWQVGYDHTPTKAPAFYGVIALATLMGVAMNFSGLDPILALVWSAVINGLLVPPLMAIVMLMASNPRIMGRLVPPKSLMVLGWLATLAMGAAASLMIFFWISG